MGWIINDLKMLHAKFNLLKVRELNRQAAFVFTIFDVSSYPTKLQYILFVVFCLFVILQYYCTNSNISEKADDYCDNRPQ